MGRYIKSYTFRSLFLSYMIVFLIPVAILLAVQLKEAYVTAERDILNNYYNEAVKTVTSVDNKIRDINSIGEKFIAKPWVVKMCSDTRVFDTEFDYIRRREISDEIANLSVGSMISEMAVIFPYKDVVVSRHSWQSTNDYFDMISSKSDEDFSYSEFISTPFSNNEQFGDIDSHSNVVFTQSLEGSSTPRAIIIFVVKKSTLANIISNASKSEIMNLTIYGGNSDSIIFEYSNLNVNTDKDTSNIRTKRINSQILADWEYVYTFSIDNVGIPFNKVIRYLFAFSMLLFVSFVTAYLLSRFTYKPLNMLISKLYSYTGKSDNLAIRDKEYSYISDCFETLISENEELKKREEKFKQTAQTDILLRVIRGYFDENGDSEKRLMEYGLDYKNSYSYCVLIAKITVKSKLDNCINKIMLYVINQIEYVLEQKSISYKLIEVVDGDVVIILKHLDYVPNTVEYEEVLGKINEQLNKSVNHNVTIFEGSVESGIIGISKSYQNAKENIRRKSFEKNIENTRNLFVKNDIFYYPTDWEIQLINNLKVGNKDTVNKIINEIKIENEKRELSRQSTNQLVTRLIETFLRVISELNVDDYLLLQEYDNVDIGDDLEAPWKLLNRMSAAICERTKYYNDSKTVSMLGEQILDYINKNYNNSDLSLKMLSDKYSLSTTTISKSFKEYTNVNYQEYVSKIRIEKGKELIRGTEINISDIGKSIGYENEFSFRRAFKRYEGISPDEYRKTVL